MREWRSTHVFPHPWELMAQAALQKYPNPHNPNVHSVDVIRQSTQLGRVTLHRLLGTLWSLPPLVLKIVGMNETAIVKEVVDIDAPNRTYTLQSTNYTFSNLLEVREKLVYFSSPDDPGKTELHQSATITVKNVPFLSGTLEDLMLSNYNRTALTGRGAVAEVAERIASELEH